MKKITKKLLLIAGLLMLLLSEREAYGMEEETFPSQEETLENKGRWGSEKQFLKIFNDVRKIHYEKYTKKKQKKIKETHVEEGDNHYRSYGGSAANEVFQEISTKLTIPIIVEFLKKIKDIHDTHILSNKGFAEVFQVLLDEVGKERNRIALKSDSPNWEKFGRRYERDDPGFMADPINEDSFPAWYRFMTEKLKDIFKSILRNQAEETRSLKSINQTLDLGGGELLIFSGKYGWGGLQGENTATIRFSIPEEFLDKPFTEDVIDILSFNDMECDHLPPSKTDDLKLEKAFKNALLWDKRQDGVDGLKERLARLMWKMSHASLYERGQAAIIGFIVQAIARLHGYTIKYSEMWSPPNNPNYDQQALSIWNIDEFIGRFKENVTMRKIRKGILTLKK